MKTLFLLFAVAPALVLSTENTTQTLIPVPLIGQFLVGENKNASLDDALLIRTRAADNINHVSNKSFSDSTVFSSKKLVQLTMDNVNRFILYDTFVYSGIISPLDSLQKRHQMSGTIAKLIQAGVPLNLFNGNRSNRVLPLETKRSQYDRWVRLYVRSVEEIKEEFDRISPSQKKKLTTITNTLTPAMTLQAINKGDLNEARVFAEKTSLFSQRTADLLFRRIALQERAIKFHSDIANQHGIPLKADQRKILISYLVAHQGIRPYLIAGPNSKITSPLKGADVLKELQSYISELEDMQDSLQKPKSKDLKDLLAIEMVDLSGEVLSKFSQAQCVSAFINGKR